MVVSDILLASKSIPPPEGTAARSGHCTEGLGLELPKQQFWFKAANTWLGEGTSSWVWVKGKNCFVVECMTVLGGKKVWTYLYLSSLLLVSEWEDHIVTQKPGSPLKTLHILQHKCFFERCCQVIAINCYLLEWHRVQEIKVNEICFCHLTWQCVCWL